MARHKTSEVISIPRPDPAGPGSLYLQLARSIEDEIRTGRLPVGRRLPAERELASHLGVSRTTVTGAYQELEARGLLRGHVGRGTVVVAAPADAAKTALPWSQRASAVATQAAQMWFGIPRDRSDVVAFDTGWPDPQLYPVEALESLSRGLLGQSAIEIYGAAPPSGDPVLRETLSRWLASRGIRTASDGVLITTGAQQGLNVLARAFLSPGDVVVTEDPTFQCALVAFRWAGADVVGVPIDHDGIQPDALEAALVRHRPKLVYLIPTFHNPTGSVMTRDRRRLVLDLAARYRVPIVESDVYSEIFFEDAPPPRLKALDGAGLVIYQGSFSKIAVPGLRVGWLVAPPGAMVPLIAAKGYQDLHTAVMMQRLAAAFMDSPHLERHLALLRAECRVRRDRLVASLRQHCPQLRFRIPPGGYYLWAQLPPPLTTDQLLPSANEAGVAVRPGPQFTPGHGGESHIRLCFAALEPRGLAEGARRLGEALEQAWRRVETPARREPAAVSAV
ncbi:MAG: PLP-dependent aminotransferase family protein [Candidatus Rokuibacteriota bacterium]